MFPGEAVLTSTGATMGDSTSRPNRVRIRRPVTATAVATSTSAGLVVAENLNRNRLHIKNADGAIVIYIGPTSGVSAANGYPLAPGAEFIDVDSTSAWYAIAASGTPSLRTLEV